MMTSQPARALVPPPVSLAVSEEEFCTWVGRAEPGSRIEYHRGNLMCDRFRVMGAYGDKTRRELAAIAGRAWRLAQEGRLALVQQRHGPNDYSYFAVKLTNPGRARRDRPG